MKFNVTKSKKLPDGKGIRGMGCCTKKRIDRFQVYYGRAIKENKGNVAAAQKVVKTILQHSVSPGEKPCPMTTVQGKNHLGVAGRESKGRTAFPPQSSTACSCGHVLLPPFDRLRS